MSEILIQRVTDRDEALALAPLLLDLAGSATAEFRDGELPADAGRRLVERGFGAPEFELVVARSDAGAEARVRGLVLTMPFADPLTGEVVPMIVLLHVDPDLRHRGLARALVGEAGRQLGRRGLTSLAARAGYNDDAVISMGERWGFLRQWDLLLREA